MLGLGETDDEIIDTMLDLKVRARSPISWAEWVSYGFVAGCPLYLPYTCLSNALCCVFW